MFKKFRKNKKGFTLIELVVVIGILGVLALLVVPNVVNRIDEAEKNVDRANLKMIQKAIEMYYIENGNYPDATDFNGLKNSLVPKYLDEWPELKSITDVTYDNTSGKLSYPGLNQQ
ncbi:MAG: prepilin-type N-terminal cleavage/methylation domain-containing protein [Caldicoprobacter oshimai]|nr:MAG: prepilin-type cleavage/methylation domain-containing protein [Caldicoprobacter oshimai]